MPLHSYMTFIMFITAFTVFASSYLHIISTLIALELVALSLYLMLMSAFSLSPAEAYISLGYLTVIVCESAIGLSIIVLFTRTKGNDLFTSMSPLLW